MGRDNKKGRGGGGGRGSGKKMFIANIEEMEMRNREADEMREERARRRAGSDAEDEPSKPSQQADSDEESTEGPKGDTVFGFQRESRSEMNNRRTGGHANDEEDEQPRGLLGGAVNPNRQPKPVDRMIKVKNLDSTPGVATADAGMNRKEREALAAEKAKEDYMKKHMAGETEQARADLARLAIVRQRREEAAAKRAAEGRAPGWSATGVESDSDSDSDSDDDRPKKGKGKSATTAEATKTPKAPVNLAAAAHEKAQAEAAAALAAKKKAAAMGDASTAGTTTTGSNSLPKISNMEIKKMNGDALKDALKQRNLDVQGQKKDLMKRLQDYETAR